MNAWINRADALRGEADRLLARLQLPGILSRYGKVVPTGSYRYGLMTWQDIDLCVIATDLAPSTIFRLGGELASMPGVGSMYYRNEFVLETPGNPSAIFWCVDIPQDSGTAWKIDILIGREEEVNRVLQEGHRLMELLTEETRGIILDIKSKLTGTPGYRKDYRSVDIYRAVLEDGVTSMDGWNAWWQGKQERQDVPD